MIPDIFPVIDWPHLFEVEATLLKALLEPTFCDPRHAAVTVDF